MEIRGSGCRWLENQEDHRWSNFFYEVLASTEHILLEKINVKRLDIAIDSFNNIGLTPKKIKSWHKRSLITSRLHTIRYMSEFHISSNQLIGDSCYIGKRASNLSILVYDKKMESEIDDRDYWFRCEIRLRDIRASRAVEQLLESPDEFGYYIASLLKEVIQFRSSTHNRTEVRRRELAPWYLTYLRFVENQHLVFF